MAQFLLSVWHDEDYVIDFSTEDAQRVVGQVGALNEQLMASGAWVFGGGLMPASSAAVARPGTGAGTGSDVTLTDGPYAETKEQIGGFWVVELPDREAALELARQAAAACEGPVEVRPFQGD
ncbi:MAG: YciI family protein [Acidimicrobiales bacterium]